MGLFDTIKKKLKDVYKKVDVAVGGILPGGYVKPKPEPTTKPEPTKVLGSPVFKSTEKEAAQSFESRTGRKATVVDVPKAEPKPRLERTQEERLELSKTREGRTQIMEEETAKRKARSAELAKQPGLRGMLRIDPDVDVFSKENIKETLQAFGGGMLAAGMPALMSGGKLLIGTLGGKAGTTSIVSKTPGTAKNVGILKGLMTPKELIGIAVAGVTSGSIMATWFAQDNIASTSSYYSNLAWDRYNDGETTKGEALNRMDQLDGNVKASKAVINLNTRINPLLWMFRGFYMEGVKAFEDNMAENRRLIETTAETTSAKFDRLRVEAEAKGIAEAEMYEQIKIDKQKDFLENQKLILAAQRASERRFAEAQAERDTNKMAWAKETAQFYEALRKRNAGETLTQIEIDLLWAWGVNPSIAFADWDAYGQSSLNFGMF